MCTFSSDTKARLGNVIVYISSNVPDPSKTKVLKLLYIMEETMTVKYGTPFLGLPFEVWINGPVQKDTYIELSNGPFLLEGYVKTAGSGENIKPIAKFDSDEFSQAELDVMESVIAKFGSKTAKALVKYLHREGSLWSRTVENKGLKEQFDQKLTNCTSIQLDLSELLDGDKKEHYEESLLIHQTANEMRARANV